MSHPHLREDSCLVISLKQALDWNKGAVLEGQKQSGLNYQLNLG